MEADRAAFAEDVREERTAPQRRPSQRKGCTHETTVLLETDLNGICGERLRQSSQIKHHPSTGITRQKGCGVAHSVTANNVPYGEGLSEFLLRPTRHFYSTPIVCKGKVIFTWKETNQNPELKKQEYKMNH